MTDKNYSLLGGLVREESGQDLLEYALLAGLIALGAVVFLNSFSTALANLTYDLINKGAAAWPQ